MDGVSKEQEAQLRNIVLNSEEYKHSEYKIGDRVHIKETYDDKIYEENGTISDAILVYSQFNLKPVILWTIKLDDGNLKIRLDDDKSIQCNKID